MSKNIILKAKSFKDKMKEIKSVSLKGKGVMEQIMKKYMESENILEKSGGWPGFTAYYNPREDYIYLPKITVSYIPKEKLSKEDQLEAREDELCTQKEFDNEDFRYERLQKLILNQRSEDVLRGYQQNLRSFYEEEKQSSVEILKDENTMLEYLKNEFFTPLNNQLKKLKLPQLDFTYVTFNEGHIQEEANGTFTYFDMVSFNVENWSTHKLCLFKNCGVNEGHNDLTKTWPVESYIYSMIDEVQTWVNEMPKEQLDTELKREPRFKMRASLYKQESE